MPRAISADRNEFKVEDSRITVDCTVSSHFGRYSFEARFLVDGGAQTSLILPARKIAQLRLTRFETYSSTGSTNNISNIYSFEPAVKMCIKFTRSGDIPETFSKVALLVAHCYKDEYDALPDDDRLVDGVSSAAAPPADLHLSDVDDAAIARDNPSSSVGKHVEVKLSPVQHRNPNDRDRVVLGQTALQELRVLANFAAKRLEFDEISVVYEH